MNRRVVVSLALIAVLVGVTRFSIVLRNENPSAEFFTDFSKAYAWGRTIWLAIVMIVGIILGHVHSRLGRLAPDAKVDIIKELRRAMSTGAVWRSLVASPLIFGLTYWMSKNQPDFAVATVLAIENGFFCDVLFKRREAEILGVSADGGRAEQASKN